MLELQNTVELGFASAGRSTIMAPSSCIRRVGFALVASAGLLITPAIAASQTPSTPSHVPLQKTIGQPAGAEIVPSLIVLNSQGAILADGKLTLTGVAPNSIVFADRPVRSAGHDLTQHILDEWSPENPDPQSFAKSPPNATVSAFTKDGSGVLDAVVVLKSPSYDGTNLIFAVDVLEGDLAGADGPASIFIDIIGRPLTPLSFAGAGRRAMRRGAFYRGAAYGAAVGAAAAAPYYPPPPPAYAPPPCGYYPYPPCY